MSLVKMDRGDGKTFLIAEGELPAFKRLNPGARRLDGEPMAGSEAGAVPTSAPAAEPTVVVAGALESRGLDELQGLVIRLGEAGLIEPAGLNIGDKHELIVGLVAGLFPEGGAADANKPRSLRSMSREELDAEAAKRDLDPTLAANKGDLITLIEEHDKAGGAS